MNKLPSFVVAALKKGLKLHRAGHSGEGLRPATVGAATNGVSSGSWSDDKILRASAWLKRHVADRQRMSNPASWDDPPKYSPAYVAWLLWGDGGDGRGAEWIHKRADKIRSKREDDNDPKTPAPPSDRIKGGRNTGRSTTTGRGIELDQVIVKALQNKLKTHNDRHGDVPAKRATLGMLKKVFLRGLGAYSTSHRPNASRSGWGYGRVDAFLYLLANGHPKNSNYITDNDLLPKEHERSTKQETKHFKETPMKEYGKMLAGMRYEMGRMMNDYRENEAMYEGIKKMLEAVTEMHCFGEDLDCRCCIHQLCMMCGQMMMMHKADMPEPLMQEMYEMMERYEEMAFGRAPMNAPRMADYDVSDEAVDNPTDAQRAGLPAAAYEPAAFMADENGDYSEDGEFQVSKSKLPHHINTVENPMDDDTVDVPRLRNALARFSQVDWTDFPEGTDVKSRAHLERHADAILYAAKEGKCADCKKEDIDALRDDLALFRAGEFDALAARQNG